MKTSKSWKTTLGASLQTLGTTLMGVGIVPGLTDMAAAEKLKWVVITGFIINAAGGFFVGLWARDNDKTSTQLGL